MKAPLPENEDLRLQALHSYRILDSPPESQFDDVAALAANICGAPIAMVSLVDADRQWFKAKTGLTASEMSRDVAFCAHAILQRDLFIVPDATKDHRFAANPLVTAGPYIRFYAGAPLIAPDGYALGTLCVIDHVPRNLSDQQQQVLRVLSSQLVSQLEARRTKLELERVMAESSAALLLRSANDKHPQGLANSSDVVGRHYMGHTNSVLMAISKCPNPTIFQKTLSVNDFYFGSRDFEFPMGHISFVGKLTKI